MSGGSSTDGAPAGAPDSPILGFSCSDFEEATYNIDPDIAMLQADAMEDLMRGNTLFEVFGDLMRVTERSLDLSELRAQGFIQDQEDLVITDRGLFMGDAMAFPHLQLMQAATEITTLGDSFKPNKGLKPSTYAGDDRNRFDCEKEYHDRHSQNLDAIGVKRSKLDSWSPFGGVFCEDYAKMGSDGPKGTVFGGKTFLDTVKGNILGRQSKVDNSGSDPTIGHGRAVNQILTGWPPDKEFAETASLSFLANNFAELRRYANANAHFPTLAGGLGIPTGRPPLDPKIENNPHFCEWYLPVLKNLADPACTTVQESLLGQSVLQSITVAEPKGAGLDFEGRTAFGKFDEIFAELNIRSKSEVLKQEGAPADLHWSEQNAWLHRHANAVDLWKLPEIITTREALGKVIKVYSDPDLTTQPDWEEPYLRQTAQRYRARFTAAWEWMRSRYSKPSQVAYATWKDLEKALRARAWDLIIDQDDPALIRAAAGLTHTRITLT